MPLHLYILRRIFFSVPLLLAITLVSFVLAHAIPADPLTANLGQHAMSDKSIVDAFRAEWGLDQPLAVQYVIYLRNLLSGNLGKSIRSHNNVLDDLKKYLPATIELATSATFFGVLFGLILGVISAVTHNSPIDFLARGFSLIGISAPVFWLALLS